MLWSDEVNKARITRKRKEEDEEAWGSSAAAAAAKLCLLHRAQQCSAVVLESCYCPWVQDHKKHPPVRSISSGPEKERKETRYLST
jgi:hypothetical protein